METSGLSAAEVMKALLSEPPRSIQAVSLSSRAASGRLVQYLHCGTSPAMAADALNKTPAVANTPLKYFMLVPTFVDGTILKSSIFQ